MISRKFLSIFSMLLLAQAAWAQKSDDIPGPAICASQEALECVPIEGCKRVSLASINAPQFISLKPGEPHLIVTLPSGELKTAKVERSEKLDGKFIFQGSEEANPEDDDAVGWTLLISEDTGHMVVTLTSKDAAFVIFGACTLI